LGVFNEENLFACVRDFRLDHSPPMHSAPVCGAAGGNDLEFIVAWQRLLRSNNNEHGPSLVDCTINTYGFDLW
jgi:hypothetical protein